MSQELWNLLKDGGIAAIDFFVGSLTGFSVEFLIKPDTPYPMIKTSQELWTIVGVTLLELFFDGILAVCLRRLMYPIDMEDPTGGMFFAMPFLMTQHTLFNNMALIWKFLMGQMGPTPPAKSVNSSPPVDEDFLE